MDQKHKHPKKETFLVEPQQCIQHLTSGWKYIISHLMLKSQQPVAIPKIVRYPWKRSYHFQPNPWNKCWMSSPAVWNHPTDLIYFCPKQQLSYDNCDSYLIITITTFLDSWDRFFKTCVIADPAALALLIFYIWLKSKTN